MSLVNMILRRGITSFFNWDKRGAIPEFSIAEFKCIVFAVAAPLAYAVSVAHGRALAQASVHARFVEIAGATHNDIPMFQLRKELDSLMIVLSSSTITE